MYLSLLQRLWVVPQIPKNRNSGRQLLGEYLMTLEENERSKEEIFLKGIDRALSDGSSEVSPNAAIIAGIGKLFKNLVSPKGKSESQGTSLVLLKSFNPNTMVN